MSAFTEKSGKEQGNKPLIYSSISANAGQSCRYKSISLPIFSIEQCFGAQFLHRGGGQIKKN